MTWLEANLSLQLTSELRVGFIMRERARMTRAQEDAAYDALASALGGTPP
jgi:hypothetical protein